MFDQVYDMEVDDLDNLLPQDLYWIVINLIENEMPVPPDFFVRLHKAGIYIDN